MDNTKPIKTTSYKDLIQSFQQAVSNPQTLREKKSTTRTLHLKKANNQNKENIQSKNHLKSTYDKMSVHHYSQWVEEDVLKQLNHKRKDKQYHFSYNKFISYITNLMASLTGYVPPELLHKKLTYLQYLAALKQIKFIKQTYEPTPTDSVAELWNQLSNSQQTVGVFILFVSGILNMKKNEDENTERYQHLWKKYSDLRYTRMQLQGKTKTVENDQQYSFSPIISQRSRTLAASRSKSKNMRDKCTNKKSASYLLQQSDDSKGYKNRCSMKQFECDVTAGNKRSQILYKLAKEKSLEKKRDKKSTEVQYEKSIKELTFKPKIHPNQKENTHKKIIQGEQDSIDRMIRGRVEREVKKIITQKGIPYNQKLFQKMKKERYEALKKNKSNSIYMDYEQFQEKKEKQPQVSEQIPSEVKGCEAKGKFPLVLSVQVDEGVIKKLVIGEGENYKQVAERFIRQLNLSQQMYEKLIIGVQNALRSQLTQIDEDSFESQYQSIC